MRTVVELDPVLIVRQPGREVGRRVVVDKDPFVIGRSSRSDLEIETESASKRHARIERTAEGWQVTDLESTNGTKLNGKAFRGSKALTSGDVIVVGHVELEWRILDEEGLADVGETIVLEPTKV
ncbi:MAG: hypothetical protein CMN30_33710 [Sandaracinus sp.]|nr:hypothetical protein [Sandaracinus sp.]